MLELKNTFNTGPQGWCSYDYHWSVVSKSNCFILGNWESSGGVEGSGYIWTDHTRWSADTPEDPVSILPFLTYTHWTNVEPLDLRDANISVYIRSDNLKLNGAKCYFWAVGKKESGRFHLKSNPLDISAGCWADSPNSFTLVNDESLWHRSWSKNKSHPPSLDNLLSNCISYGISLVGFDNEPTGRLSIDELIVTLRK